MATSTTKTQIEIPATDTLVDVPKRAFVFLNAIGTQPSIRAAMFANSYTDADHTEGWDLLRKAAGGEFSIEHLEIGPSAAAVKALDAADEVLLHRAHAVLVRGFASQVEFLFQDLAPTQGPAAVLGVLKFLDRLDVLEKGRKGSEADDKKAVDALATRGIDAAERARLRKLVDEAQKAGPVPAPDPNAVQSDEEHEKNLAALYAWYASWTEIAQAVITNRRDRILLGIAKRRKSERVTAPSPVPAPAAASTTESESTGKVQSIGRKRAETAA